MYGQINCVDKLPINVCVRDNQVINFENFLQQDKECSGKNIFYTSPKPEHIRRYAGSQHNTPQAVVSL